MSEEMGLFLAIAEWLNSPGLADAVEKIAGWRGITSPADIDDLVQEVRIALWQKGLHQAVSAAWIARVASNKVVDMIRRRSRRRRVERAASSRRPTDPELTCLLHATTSSLSTDLKRFYALHYLLALSERELAKRLRLRRSGVRRLDRRCREELELRSPDRKEGRN